MADIFSDCMSWSWSRRLSVWSSNTRTAAPGSDGAYGHQIVGTERARPLRDEGHGADGSGSRDERRTDPRARGGPALVERGALGAGRGRDIAGEEQRPAAQRELQQGIVGT